MLNLSNNPRFPYILYENQRLVNLNGQEITCYNLGIARISTQSGVDFVDGDRIFTADKLLAVSRKMTERVPLVYFDKTGVKLEIPDFQIVVKGKIGAVEAHMKSSVIFSHITRCHVPKEFRDIRKYLC